MLSASAAISEYLSGFSRDRVLNYVGLYDFLISYSFFPFSFPFFFYCDYIIFLYLRPVWILLNCWGSANTRNGGR